MLAISDLVVFFWSISYRYNGNHDAMSTVVSNITSPPSKLSSVALSLEKEHMSYFYELLQFQVPDAMSQVDQIDA